MSRAGVAPPSAFSTLSRRVSAFGIRDGCNPRAMKRNRSAIARPAVSGAMVATLASTHMYRWGTRLTETDIRPDTAVTSSIRPLIVGNWKMNGLKSAIADSLKVRDALKDAAQPADVMICPPTTLIMLMAEVQKGSPVRVGAQDCHGMAFGACTGDVAAEMLADAGASAVILGHSERRALHGERDCDVRAKVAAAHRAGLQAIVCVGETAGQRASDLTLEVVVRQLLASLPDTATAANTVIAYEPVWAIGTGLTATARDVAEVHAALRAALVGRDSVGGPMTRILYGGSVKASNAHELLSVANVNGALVGGASLVAADFLAIIGSA
jgi:triosephosphate isomerase (TIM)